MCAVIRANICKHKWVSRIQAYYKRQECLILTNLDQHVSGMMTSAGKNFYNFLWSRFLIIMQNVNMATNAKCNCRPNPIKTSADTRLDTNSYCPYSINTCQSATAPTVSTPASQQLAPTVSTPASQLLPLQYQHLPVSYYPYSINTCQSATAPTVSTPASQQLAPTVSTPASQLLPLQYQHLPVSYYPYSINTCQSATAPTVPTPASQLLPLQYQHLPVSYFPTV